MTGRRTGGEEAALNLGLFGLGTVGSGVVELLGRRNNATARPQLALKKIVEKDLSRCDKVSVRPELVRTEPEWILDDPDIDTVIEVIGGLHPAEEFIRAALAAGKNVVTANKAVLARVGADVYSEARNRGCSVGVRAAHIASFVSSTAS